MTGTTLSRGNVIKQFVLQPSLTPTTVTASISAEQSFTVIGLLMGDIIEVNSNTAHPAGIGISNARVSAANTLTIQFVNTSTAAANASAASGVYNVMVSRPEGTPPVADV